MFPSNPVPVPIRPAVQEARQVVPSVGHHAAPLEDHHEDPSVAHHGPCAAGTAARSAALGDLAGIHHNPVPEGLAVPVGSFQEGTAVGRPVAARLISPTADLQVECRVRTAMVVQALHTESAGRG